MGTEAQVAWAIFGLGFGYGLGILFMFSKTGDKFIDWAMRKLP